MVKLNKDNALYNKKHILQYLKNIDDANKYSYKSGTPIECVCPSCGLERKIVIRYLVKRGFYCRVCDKNIPMSESTFYAMSIENNIKVVPQKTFKGFMTENNKYYFFDFYIEELNICIELMGGQHYLLNESSMWEEIESVQKRDRIKEEYCKKNGINYVAIDCRKSDYNFIIDNILNSEIGYIFKKVDRENIIIKALENKNHKDVKKIIADFNNGLSYKYIMNKYDIERHNIIRILERSGNYTKRNTGVKIICVNDNKVFNSIPEASDYYNVKYHFVVSNLTKAIKRVKTNDGYIAFCYADRIEELEEIKKESETSKIICVTTNEVFENVKEASNFYSIKNIYAINRCLNGQRKSAGRHPITNEKLIWDVINE